MGPSPRLLVRALLTLGLAGGLGAASYGQERPPGPPAKARSGWPVREHAPWDPPNYTDLPPRELAERMGFGNRIDALLRGEPSEDDQFYWEDGVENNLLGGEPSPPPIPVDPPDYVTPDEAEAAWRAELEEARRSGVAPPDPREALPDPGRFGPPRMEEEAAGRVTPEDVEASVADILGITLGQDFDDPDAALDPEAEPPPPEELQVLPDPEEVDGFLRREGLDGSLIIRQSAGAGFLDSEYSSVADGKTTTESRYLEHHVVISRGLDQRSDLVLRNDLLVDILRLRNTSTGTWARQIETSGRLEATLALTRQESNEDEGEIEPDHDQGQFQISGGRDAADGLTWDVTAYGSSLDYDTSDIFFLDRDLLGAGATGSYAIGGVELYGRHVLERDMYPDASGNDTNRLQSEISVLTRPRYDLDIVYTSLYEREGVAIQRDLDSYRAWTTEGTARKYFGERAIVSLTVGKRSTTVDQVSAFLFDNREYYLFPEVDFQVDPLLAFRLSWRGSAVRNRRKNPFLDETLDDREMNDWELGMEYVGPIFDASILGYLGRTRHVNGQREFFADFDRRGVTVTVGFRAGRFGRGEFTYTRDEEEYTTFAVNDNEARTTGARYVLEF